MTDIFRQILKLKSHPIGVILSATVLQAERKPALSEAEGNLARIVLPSEINSRLTNLRPPCTISIGE
jgi:hypothetical protein